MEEEAEAEREEGAFFESQSKDHCQDQITSQGPMFNWPTILWNPTLGHAWGRERSEQGQIPPAGMSPNLTSTGVFV